MIEVEVTVKLNNGVTINVSKEEYGMAGGHSLMDAEHAQTLLLDAYHKAKSAIESQK